MRALVLVAFACGHPVEPTAPVIDPAPPPGVPAPRGVSVVHVEAHPAPAKQRWVGVFAPTTSSLADAIASYRADLVAGKIDVTGFPWEPRALDFSVGQGDTRLDVFVRPGDDDKTFSIAVDVPGL
jgi:hypothetical protein